MSNIVTSLRCVLLMERKRSVCTCTTASYLSKSGAFHSCTRFGKGAEHYQSQLGGDDDPEACSNNFLVNCTST